MFFFRISFITTHAPLRGASCGSCHNLHYNTHAPPREASSTNQPVNCWARITTHAPPARGIKPMSHFAKAKTPLQLTPLREEYLNNERSNNVIGQLQLTPLCKGHQHFSFSSRAYIGITTPALCEGYLSSWSDHACRSYYNSCPSVRGVPLPQQPT